MMTLPSSSWLSWLSSRASSSMSSISSQTKILLVKMIELSFYLWLCIKGLKSILIVFKKGNITSWAMFHPFFFCRQKGFSSWASQPINIRWIKTGSRPYWIALYNRQFSTNIKIKIIRLLPVLLARAFVPLRFTNLVLIL